jgi:hypothetical protein
MGLSGLLFIRNHLFFLPFAHYAIAVHPVCDCLTPSTVMLYRTGGQAPTKKDCIFNFNCGIIPFVLND